MSGEGLALRLLGILFPIFGIVAAGYFYGRQHKPEMAVANRLNMDVFVPALVFAAMAGKSFDLAAYAPLALGGFLVIGTCGLLAWPVARLVGIQPKTLVPPMLFNNSGNIGLPLAVLAWGEAALPAAVILFMPVVAAAIAGLTVALLKIPVWEPAVIAIRMLGDVSVPLLLFSLGVRMTDVSFRDWKLPVGAALLRPLAGMAVAWGVIQLLGLQGRDAAMLLVFGALPPAVLNFLFAERYRQEPHRVASIVLIGNLGALIFLPLSLALVLR
ncbi:MAG: AEC family transporter [Xanthomonadales bacterium]|nr:AEC family transporter [Xanthomonadales bacterium]